MKLTPSKIIKDERGALHEFISLILFLIIVLGLLIPLMVELFIYNNQAQEMDRLTKIAAKRACTLMPLATRGIGADLKQGSLGVGTDVRIMQPLVNSVFKNEAAHPETYFENTPDGNIKLRILDFLGNEIDQKELEKVTDNRGNSQNVLLVGSNTDAALCPAGSDPSKGWKYCLSKEGDQLAIKNLSSTGLPKNEDLVARMEMFQPGRCGAGKECNDDFRGRIDRCTVCATKSRESIFARSVFLRTILFMDCKGKKPVTVLPCKMTACATSRYVQYSGKRAYAPYYRDKVNLGQGFRALESNPNAKSEALDFGDATRPDGDLFCNMTADYNPKTDGNVGGMFRNRLPDGSCPPPRR